MLLSSPICPIFHISRWWVGIGEFESVEQALRWYNSAEFAPARSLRSRFAKINEIAVPGV